MNQKLKCDERDIGIIVIHFKRHEVKDSGSMRHLYKILAIAQNTETDEKLVIYQALYDDMKVWARPFSSFYEKINKGKYPGANQEYRFEKCN